MQIGITTDGTQFMCEPSPNKDRQVFSARETTHAYLVGWHIAHNQNVGKSNETATAEINAAESRLWHIHGIGFHECETLICARLDAAEVAAWHALNRCLSCGAIRHGEDNPFCWPCINGQHHCLDCGEALYFQPESKQRCDLCTKTKNAYRIELQIANDLLAHRFGERNDRT